MKFTNLILLVLILAAVVANLLFGLGMLSVGSSEYRAVPAVQMDEIGFRKLADANGIEVGEDGKIKFPNEMRGELLKYKMLPFTISEIEKEGFEFITVTSDDHYLFRKK
ncbi:MAG: hypothetical protein P1U89_19495 [Verrucomicrobiales bacterium]|nr:hypothetical protein [Verrucomicrobiales bacterium]